MQLKSHFNKPEECGIPLSLGVPRPVLGMYGESGACPAGEFPRLQRQPCSQGSAFQPFILGTRVNGSMRTPGQHGHGKKLGTLLGHIAP